MIRCSRSMRAERGLFRPDYVRHLLDEHCSLARDHHTRLWALLMLELWFQMWIDTPAEDRDFAPGGVSRGAPSNPKSSPMGRVLTGSPRLRRDRRDERLSIGRECPRELTQCLLVPFIRDLSKVAGELEAHPFARTDPALALLVRAHRKSN